MPNASLCLTALIASMLVGIGSAAAQALAPVEVDCAAIKGTKSIPFDGGVLREAPDLARDELRDINAMMNVRACFVAAQQRFDVYTTAHPDDYTAEFVAARFIWRMGDVDGAKRLLERLVAAHPDFASGHVLLGSLILSQGEVGFSREAFDRAAALSPDDLWLNVNRLRLDAMTRPTPRTFATLVKMVETTALPPFAREAAATAVMESPALTLAQREAVYRAQLTFESATPRDMKLVNLGRFQIEDQKQFAAGRATLTPLFDTRMDDEARTLVAESYLFEAAAIDGQPSARNAALVDKAKSTVGGDLTPVALRIAAWPDLRALQPFVTGHTNPDATDEHGVTALCHAVYRLDAEAVASALAAGASPDGLCGDSTPLGKTIMMGSQDWDRKRAIATLLLDRGANPDPVISGGHYTALSFCVKGEAQCAEEIRPLLLKYVKPAAK